MYDNDNPIKAIINKYKRTIESKTKFNKNGYPMRYIRCFDTRILENGDTESIIEEIKDYFGEYDIYSISYTEDWLDKTDDDYEDKEPDMMRLTVAYMDRGQIRIVTENVWKDKGSAE